MGRSTVTCVECGYSETFEDDGETVNGWPDGVLVDGGPEWVCSECMVDEDLAHPGRESKEVTMKYHSHQGKWMRGKWRCEKCGKLLRRRTGE